MNKVFKTLREVIEDKELTYLDKTVFTSLITFNGKNKIFPSLAEIGNRINCNSINNISKSIGKLKEKNFIEVVRRFQKSSIYKIQDVKCDVKIKNNNIVKKNIIPLSEPVQINFINKSILEAVAVEVARCKGYSIPESSDFAFVNSILKLKKEDVYKNDNFDYVRKCIMLMYLINIHKDKFSPGNNPYAYFNKVYSLTSYSDIRQKIFCGAVKVNEYITIN